MSLVFRLVCLFVRLFVVVAVCFLLLLLLVVLFVFVVFCCCCCFFWGALRERKKGEGDTGLAFFWQTTFHIVTRFHVFDSPLGELHTFLGGSYSFTFFSLSSFLLL